MNVVQIWQHVIFLDDGNLILYRKYEVVLIVVQVPYTNLVNYVLASFYTQIILFVQYWS
jgi:hypothetical protein